MSISIAEEQTDNPKIPLLLSLTERDLYDLIETCERVEKFSKVSGILRGRSLPPGPKLFVESGLFNGELLNSDW